MAWKVVRTDWVVRVPWNSLAYGDSVATYHPPVSPPWSPPEPRYNHEDSGVNYEHVAESWEKLLGTWWGGGASSPTGSASLSPDYGRIAIKIAISCAAIWLIFRLTRFFVARVGTPQNVQAEQDAAGNPLPDM